MSQMFFPVFFPSGRLLCGGVALADPGDLHWRHLCSSEGQFEPFPLVKPVQRVVVGHGMHVAGGSSNPALHPLFIEDVKRPSDMTSASRCFPKLVCKWLQNVSSGENLRKQLEEMMRADLEAPRFWCALRRERLDVSTGGSLTA